MNAAEFLAAQKAKAAQTGLRLMNQAKAPADTLSGGAAPTPAKGEPALRLFRVALNSARTVELLAYDAADAWERYKKSENIISSDHPHIVTELT